METRPKIVVVLGRAWDGWVKFSWSKITWEIIWPVPDMIAMIWFWFTGSQTPSRRREERFSLSIAAALTQPADPSLT